MADSVRNETSFTVERILDYDVLFVTNIEDDYGYDERMPPKKYPKKHQVRYLVSWVGYGPEDNSWEPQDCFQPWTDGNDRQCERIYKKKSKTETVAQCKVRAQELSEDMMAKMEAKKGKGRESSKKSKGKVKKATGGTRSTRSLSVASSPPGPKGRTTQSSATANFDVREFLQESSGLGAKELKSLMKDKSPQKKAKWKIASESGSEDGGFADEDDAEQEKAAPAPAPQQRRRVLPKVVSDEDEEFADGSDNDRTPLVEEDQIFADDDSDTQPLRNMVNEGGEEGDDFSFADESDQEMGDARADAVVSVKEEEIDFADGSDEMVLSAPAGGQQSDNDDFADGSDIEPVSAPAPPLTNITKMDEDVSFADEEEEEGHIIEAPAAMVESDYEFADDDDDLKAVKPSASALVGEESDDVFADEDDAGEPALENMTNSEDDFADGDDEPVPASHSTTAAVKEEQDGAFADEDEVKPSVEEADVEALPSDNLLPVISPPVHVPAVKALPSKNGNQAPSILAAPIHNDDEFADGSDEEVNTSHPPSPGRLPPSANQAQETFSDLRSRSPLVQSPSAMSPTLARSDSRPASVSRDTRSPSRHDSLAPPLARQSSAGSSTNPSQSFSLRQHTAEDPWNVGINKDDISTDGFYKINAANIDVKLRAGKFYENISAELKSVQSTTPVAKITYLWGIPNILDNVMDFGQSFRNKTCWIFAPKSREKLGKEAAKTLLDVQALQILLDECNACHKAEMSNDVQAVFIHASEQDGIGRYPEPWAELNSLETFRRNDLMVFVFGGPENLFKRIWSTQAAVGFSAHALTTDPYRAKALIEQVTNIRSMFRKRNAYCWAPATFCLDGGPFAELKREPNGMPNLEAMSVEEGPTTPVQRADNLAMGLFKEAVRSGKLSLLQPRLLPRQSLVDRSDSKDKGRADDALMRDILRMDFLFPFQEDELALDNSGMEDLARWYVGDLKDCSAPAVEDLARQARAKYIQVHRWIVVVSQAEKDSMVPKSGIELMTVEEAEIALAD